MQFHRVDLCFKGPVGPNVLVDYQNDAFLLRLNDVVIEAFASRGVQKSNHFDLTCKKLPTQIIMYIYFETF